MRKGIVARERRQHTAQSALRRFLECGEEPEEIADRVDREIFSHCSPGEMLDEVTRWLIHVRGCARQGDLLLSSSMTRLVAAFARVAEKRNVAPDQFYASLVSKLVLDGSVEEAARGMSKVSTKGRILEAALEVFSEKGFHLATVDEIADLAGVGKGTLYRYFANKETLFNELVRLRLEELEEEAKAVLDGQDDVLTMIAKYLRAYFNFFDRNQRLYRLIVQERLDVGKQVQDLYVKKIMRRIPLLKRKIYGASQQGVLKDVDFQTVFFGVMGFVHGVIQKWLAADCSYPLIDDLPTVIEVLFHGFVKSSHKKTGMEEESN